MKYNINANIIFTNAPADTIAILFGILALEKDPIKKTAYKVLQPFFGL